MTHEKVSFEDVDLGRTFVLNSQPYVKITWGSARPVYNGWLGSEQSFADTDILDAAEVL